MLSQEIEIRDHQVVVHLHNHFQETLINTIKVDILTFLREKLQNNRIQLMGEHTTVDEKKVIYTNREKFDHLVEKNPTRSDANGCNRTRSALACSNKLRGIFTIVFI